VLVIGTERDGGAEVKRASKPTFRFNLRFPASDIETWAARYAYATDEPLVAELAPRARERGYLTYDEFLAVCRWKTRRSASRCRSNDPALVEEATRAALSAKHERLKVGALLVLSGVQWPTASVILHFCDRGKYPILDYRALWSLGYKKPPTYTFPFWAAYCEFTRKFAKRARVSMRRLDQALWQFSKEKQG
jgi:hypothetical protein